MVYPSGNRVLLAMSGGVDSSAAALLLQDAGYEVVGMTLRLLPSDEAARAIEEALAVCSKLGIEHHVVPYEGEFEDAVIGSFCGQYLNGLTPNPCIECNRRIKFTALEKLRGKLACSHIATGHYAQVGYDSEMQRHLLLQAADLSKDQSYVLYNLKQEELAHLLLPLGRLSKDEIRRIAADAGFANADKPDSQDICFIPDGDYPAFIMSHADADPEEGPIADRDGNILGTHRGLLHYTIGQRKGIGVAASEPLYVFEKRRDENTLVVDTAANTLVDRISVTSVNFIGRAELPEPAHLFVKAHYRQRPQPALVTQAGRDSIEILFDEPQRACAPGQSAVCYEGSSVICGGIIA